MTLSKALRMGLYEIGRQRFDNDLHRLFAVAYPVFHPQQIQKLPVNPSEETSLWSRVHLACYRGNGPRGRFCAMFRGI